MNAVGTRLRLWGVAAPSVLCMLLGLVSMGSGCGKEEVVEQSPETFEQAREEHREMMRRETGQK